MVASFALSQTRTSTKTSYHALQPLLHKRRNILIPKKVGRVNSQKERLSLKLNTFSI